MSQQRDYYTKQQILNSIILISIFTSICTAISLILLLQVFGATNFQRTETNLKLNRYSRLLVFCCVLIATMCEWSDLIRHLICYFLDKQLFYYPLNNIMGFADFLYYLGCVLFYIIAISRLQISFSGSQYAISCPLLSFFYALIASVLCLACYYTVIVAMSPDTDIEQSFWAKHDTIPMIIAGVFDFVLNVSNLTLFISKLNQILKVRVSGSDLNEIHEDANSVSTDSASRDLLHLMTRHLILFGIAIIINQVWYIMVLLEYHLDIDMRMSAFVWRGLVNACNCTVLYLGLKRNAKCYSCLCGCCHRKIQDWWTGCCIASTALGVRTRNIRDVRRNNKAPSRVRLITSRDLSSINEETS